MLNTICGEVMKKDKNNNLQVDVLDNLKLEKVDQKKLKDSLYDFVPRLDHWTNSDEQIIKVKEIEKKTKQ